MRGLDPKESEIVSAIMAFSVVREWEFSAALDSKTFELEYFGTRMLRDASEFPCCINHLAMTKNITVHHNHLSKESLSWADWRGLTIAKYHETFAHCADGTMYWGQVCNRPEMNISADWKKTNEIDKAATSSLQSGIVGKGFGRQFENYVWSFFIKHVVAEALKAKGYVQYEVTWGACLLPIQAMIACVLKNAVSSVQEKIP